MKRRGGGNGGVTVAIVMVVLVVAAVVMVEGVGQNKQVSKLPYLRRFCWPNMEIATSCRARHSNPPLKASIRIYWTISSFYCRFPHFSHCLSLEHLSHFCLCCPSLERLRSVGQNARHWICVGPSPWRQVADIINWEVYNKSVTEYQSINQPIIQSMNQSVHHSIKQPKNKKNQ